MSRLVGFLASAELLSWTPTALMLGTHVVVCSARKGSVGGGVVVGEKLREVGLGVAFFEPGARGTTERFVFLLSALPTSSA